MGIFTKKENTDQEPVNLEPHYYTAEEIKRKDGEKTQDYNERVPVAFQPVAEQPKTNYLGEPRE